MAACSRGQLSSGSAGSWTRAGLPYSPPALALGQRPAHVCPLGARLGSRGVGSRGGQGGGTSPRGAPGPQPGPRATWPRLHDIRSCAVQPTWTTASPACLLHAGLSWLTSTGTLKAQRAQKPWAADPAWLRSCALIQAYATMWCSRQRLLNTARSCSAGRFSPGKVPAWRCCSMHMNTHMRLCTLPGD